MKKSTTADSNAKSANQSVTKFLQLLSCMAESRRPMRLIEIADNIQMPQATVLRYLNALIEEGFAFHNEISGKYGLTWKICGIGEEVSQYLSLRTIAGDIIEQLHEKLSLGTCLVIEHNMECMYLDCLYNPSEMGFQLVRIGKQTPLYATSSGKLLLSQYSQERLEEFFTKTKLCAFTEHTITDRDKLIKELSLIQKQGFSLDDEECELGLRCIAAPILGYNRQIVAAVSVFGSAARLTDDYIHDQILPSLKEAATQISFRAGGTYTNKAVD